MQHALLETDTHIIQGTYDFVRPQLGRTLAHLAPADLVRNHPERNWCLADPPRTYLVYALTGGPIELDRRAAKGSFRACWVDPRTGAVRAAAEQPLAGGRCPRFTAPDRNDWALWLTAVPSRCVTRRTSAMGAADIGDPVVPTL
jgi:hypothetical protein